MTKNLGKFEIDKIYCEDCLKSLDELPDGSMDLVLTDPPFAINFKAKRNNYNRTAGNVIEGYKEIPKEKYLDFSKEWINQSFRVLKDNGSMYVFSGWNNLKDILIALDEAEFTTLNHLIWKYQFGVFTKKKFVTSHYHILFVVKNPKEYTFNKIDHYPEDVMVVNREYWTNKIKTPTKLPSDLVKKLILYSTKKDDLILDPFMGSGTTAIMAKVLERHFLGFEIVKDFTDFANQRLSKLPTDFIGIKNYISDNNYIKSLKLS